MKKSFFGITFSLLFALRTACAHDHEEHEHDHGLEGQTELSDVALKVADIEIETAGPQSILNSARVYGRILPNEDQVAHISARFPGIVKEVRKALGDQVQKNEVLAVVESNHNLQPYELRSHIAGVVVMRHATPGEFVREDQEILVVADLSEVWADFQIYRDEFETITLGQEISIDLGQGREAVKAAVKYISPLTDIATQSKLIRAVLPNEHGSLRPGLFISGVLTSSEEPVPVAVKREALQVAEEKQVVFTTTDGHRFQAAPVKLGRRDNRYVEVLEGLRAGDKYVSRNSFIIKADIEKRTAAHEH